MSGLLLFRNFEKRHNSTKRPDLSQGVNKNVNLKENTSLRNPTFLLHDFDYAWNYCTFGYRYYYIDDVVFNSNNLYEIRCSIDVLATFKDSILATKANILYCSDSAKNIIDKRIPITNGYSTAVKTSAVNDFTFTQYYSAVILGVTGKGSFGQYLLNNASELSSILDGVDDWSNSFITDTLTAIKQLVYGGSASENLKSAIALPMILPASDVGGSSEDLILGNYPCKNSSGNAIKVTKITTMIKSSDTNVDIPWQFSDWRRNSPYTDVYIYLPFIGTISLPSASVLEENALTISYALNVTSGDLCVSWKGTKSGRIIGTASANIALATPFGSTGVDTTKLTTAITTGAGSLVTAGIMGATGGGAGAIALTLFGGLSAAANGTIDAFGGSGAGGGGLGGGAGQGLDKSIHIYTVTRQLTDTQASFSETMGKPFFAKDNVGNHSGFVMTEGFSSNMTGFEDDKNEISRLMDAGVYIE